VNNKSSILISVFDFLLGIYFICFSLNFLGSPHLESFLRALYNFQFAILAPSLGCVVGAILARRIYLALKGSLSPWFILFSSTFLGLAVAVAATLVFMYWHSLLPYTGSEPEIQRMSQTAYGLYLLALRTVPLLIGAAFLCLGLFRFARSLSSKGSDLPC